MNKSKSRGRRSKDIESKKERKETQLRESVKLELSKHLGSDDENGDREEDDEGKPIEQQIQTPFFGLVDSQELDYFKNAESTLNINAFDSDDDRALFINSVLEEGKGKELKLVTNQICSKLMERLILNASDEQIKLLYEKFNGHFAPLAHHKYASHCIETLFKRTAELVENEILYPQEADALASGEVFVSVENLFLYLCGEFKPYLKEMTKHQYASHVLRLVLLILSGREIPSSIELNSLLRSKKSKIARKMIEIKDNSTGNRSYKIPQLSFFDQLKDMLSSILKGQDTPKLREACINAVSSPTYSLILSIEGLVLKERPFWDLVFQSQDTRKDAKEELFVEYCLSDAVGSHFLQLVLKQARLRSLERIFEFYIEDRVLKIAKREQTGAFVVQVLISRMKGEHLFKTLDQLIDNLTELASNQELVKLVIQVSQLRKNYRRADIVAHILGEQYSRESFLDQILKLPTSTLGNTRDDWPTSQERRDAFYLESLFVYDETILNLALDNILETFSNEKLINMCKHGVFSHVIEQLLAQFQKFETVKRRKFMNLILESDKDFVSMLCNSNGSHIVDKLWGFTTKLNNYKEKISNLLIANSTTVKNSTYGKMVWKNWSIDMYQRKRFDWKLMVREQEQEYFPPPPKEEDGKDKKRVGNEKHDNVKRARRV